MTCILITFLGPSVNFQSRFKNVLMMKLVEIDSDKYRKYLTTTEKLRRTALICSILDSKF